MAWRRKRRLLNSYAKLDKALCQRRPIGPRFATSEHRRGDYRRPVALGRPVVVPCTLRMCDSVGASLWVALSPQQISPSCAATRHRDISKPPRLNVWFLSLSVTRALCPPHLDHDVATAISHLGIVAWARRLSIQCAVHRENWWISSCGFGQAVLFTGSPKSHGVPHTSTPSLAKGALSVPHSCRVHKWGGHRQDFSATIHRSSGAALGRPRWAPRATAIMYRAPMRPPALWRPSRPPWCMGPRRRPSPPTGAYCRYGRPSEQLPQHGRH